MTKMYTIDRNYRRAHYHKARCIICGLRFLARVLTVSCYGKPVVLPVCPRHRA